ncbi:MAG: hypothetical protein J6E31_02830 [Pyramidobacter sp.]|nr:hypothetical protein [Pyramidobacter sp.]
MLPEAVAEAISRQDTQAEMAEIDARTARAGKQKRKSTWVIESPIVGRIEQNDAPRIMTELLNEAILEKNGVKRLAAELKLMRPSNVSSFAEGKIYMGRETGKLLVSYLENRAMEKEKAASAGTETTQRSEDTDQGTSTDIVPQEAKEVIDDMAAQKEAQLFNLQNTVASLTDENAALRGHLESAREALANEQKESAERLIHLEDTQAKLEEKTIEAADLRDRLKTAEEQNAGLRTDLNDSKALHEEIKRQLDEMRPAVAELTENVQRLQNENDAMSAALRHEKEGRLKALDTLCDLVREMLGSNA